MWIKVDDTVKILAGNDKDKNGRVLSVDRAAGKVVVEGLNRVKKHVRRSQNNPQGGVLSKEMPLPMSRVALVCPSCSKATRVGARLATSGNKERFCKKCGATVSVITPKKPEKSAS